VPSIHKFQLDTSIEDALVAARNSMLPDAFARSELGRWITGMDSLRPDQGQEAAREPRLNELVTFIILEEALTFYLATLYHLGRVIQSCDSRMKLISRLQEGSNFKASTARITSRTNMSLRKSGLLLQEQCAAEVDFQKQRKGRALKGWALWQEWVGAFKVLLTSHAPLLETDAGVGVSLLLCTNGTQELLNAVPEDKDSFLASYSPTLSRLLDGIASSRTEVYSTFTDAEYWSNVEQEYLRIAPASQSKHANALRLPSFAQDRVHTGVGLPPEYLDLVGDTPIVKPSAHTARTDIARIEQARTERRIRRMTEGGKWDEGLVPQARIFLQKLTKLFIVGGRRPPLWERVLSVARWTWIASALRQADVSAEYLVNSFADELIVFSKQGEAPMPRIPLADDEWSTCTTLFFHNWWAPSLRAKGAGRLPKLSERKFELVLKAAAFLLGAMGYAVVGQKVRLLPGGGGLTESGRASKFDSL
jgi:hypothetical protein